MTGGPPAAAAVPGPVRYPSSDRAGPPARPRAIHRAPPDEPTRAPSNRARSHARPRAPPREPPRRRDVTTGRHRIRAPAAAAPPPRAARLRRQRAPTSGTGGAPSRPADRARPPDPGGRRSASGRTASRRLRALPTAIISVVWSPSRRSASAGSSPADRGRVHLRPAVQPEPDPAGRARLEHAARLPRGRHGPEPRDHGAPELPVLPAGVRHPHQRRGPGADPAARLQAG